MTQPFSKLIYIDIYAVNLLLSVNQTDDQLKSLITRYSLLPYLDDPQDIVEPMNGDRGYLLKDTDNYSDIIIRLDDFNLCPADIGTLTHEIFHATCYIMSSIGMKLHPANEEAYAYLISFLTETCIREIDKHTTKS